MLYQLYTIIDIFGREVVGWIIATRESEVTVRELVSKTCKRVHDLGIHKSHSRPRMAKKVKSKARRRNYR